MSVQIQNDPCPIMSLPEDLLWGGMIPECRVLLMARTCTWMQKTLERGRCGVDITVKRKVCRDASVARIVAPGINNIQACFRIRRFECCAPMRQFQLRFNDFEELTLMHLRTLKMDANALTELHMLSVLYMFTFSSDMRTFEFTQQSLKSRHIPWLAHCMHGFTRLETLSLDKNFFVFDSLGLVLDAIQTTTLATLNLSTNSCEDECKTLKLCRVIQTNSNSLKVLKLSFMRLSHVSTYNQTSFDSMLKALSTCRFLEDIDLSHNHLHYSRLMDVLSATAGCRLQSLNWSGNRLGSAGSFILGNHIMHNDIWQTTLRDLNMGMCDVYDGLQSLGDALAMCKGLKSLNISSNAVYAHEVATILNKQRLTSLNINSNYISDYGMQLVLQCAMQSPTLKDLHILGNHMCTPTLRRFRQLSKGKKIAVCMPSTACACNICQSIGT